MPSEWQTATFERDSPLLREARAMAADLHAGQRRKASRMPYLEHVVSVAAVLDEAGFDDDVLAAALLHDTVEHTELGLAELRKRFGERIGAMVEAMTDDDGIADWERRKEEHRSRIGSAGRDAAAIYAADKLCAIRETRDGFAQLAEQLEERLGNPLDLRIEAWESDLKMLSDVEPPVPFAGELASELERLRAERAISART
jgi:(p)ppGpp synthase/HD superfamily hydrolase